MELSQTKLTKSEWDGIEIPLAETEVNVLNLLVTGYHDVNVRINHHNSLFTFLKIEYSEKMEDYLFNKYFRQEIVNMITKYNVDFIDISNSVNNENINNENINNENINNDIKNDQTYCLC